MTSKISELRLDYRRMSLDEKDLHPDPVEQFRRWFDQALEADVAEPNAMALATATADGSPSVRYVLLKEFEKGRFVFFSNYESRKGRELGENRRAALAFYWPELERQVRIEGPVEVLPAEESDAYFHSRPRGSQLGAWASKQSEPVASKPVAYAKLALVVARYGLGTIPRPPHWGGYAVCANMIEFWQGRPNRFHDRLRYTKRSEGEWVIERLWP